MEHIGRARNWSPIEHRLFEAGLLMSVTFQAAIANLKLKGLSWNRLAACASVLLGTGRMAFFTYFLLYFLIFGAASDNMYLLSKYNFVNSVSLIAFLITPLVQILIGPSQYLAIVGDVMCQCCPHSDGLPTECFAARHAAFERVVQADAFARLGSYGQAAKRIAVHGMINPPKRCIVSFPGKYWAEWDCCICSR